jgi:hypothetical protein
MEEYSNLRTEFQEDSHVLLTHRTSLRRRGNPESKLLPFRRGPLRVERQDGSHYKLRNLVNGKLESHHVTEMTEFKYDNTTTNPADIALRDELEPQYTLERITAFKGNIKKVSSLTFYCKWLNYEDRTWEPWANVRKTRVLHSFLRGNNNPRVQALVPEQFVEDDDSEADDKSEDEDMEEDA